MAMRQAPATNRQVVQMRRETVQIIKKQVQDPLDCGEKTSRRVRRALGVPTTSAKLTTRDAEHLVCQSQRAMLHLRRGVSTDHETHRPNAAVAAAEEAGALISAREALAGVAEAEHAKHTRIHSQAPVRCNVWYGLSRTATCNKAGQSSGPSEAVSEHAAHKRTVHNHAAHGTP